MNTEKSIPRLRNNYGFVLCAQADRLHSRVRAVAQFAISK
jgi:hypothetical protein